MSLIDNVRVRVPSHSELSYESAFVHVADGWLMFHRPSPISDHRDQVSYQGAHITLDFPARVLMNGSLGKEAQFRFSGTEVGSLTKLTGPPSYDHGSGQQDITDFIVRSRLDKDEFWMNISGKLRTSDKGWFARRISSNEANVAESFEIRMEITTRQLLTTVRQDLGEIIKRFCGIVE